MPDNRISSTDLENRLAPLYDKLNLPQGRLELMSGIQERRFWDKGVFPSEVATSAGKKAIEDSGIEALVPSSDGQAKMGVSLPCVVTCDKGPNEPRRPNVRGIMMAKKAAVELKGFDAPSPTVTVVENIPPPAKPPGKTFEGAENIPEVVKALRDEANVI